jgi:hypothetical protein
MTRNTLDGHIIPRESNPCRWFLYGYISERDRMKWIEDIGEGRGVKIGWSSGKCLLLVQTNMCFVWVCCQYNTSSLEHYGSAVMYICQNELFQIFTCEIVACLMHYQIRQLKLSFILWQSYFVVFCVRILYVFFFIILGVRGTFRWNHAASGKCHKCMRFLQSLMKREVLTAFGEGHISSYFSGISYGYREARFVCLQWRLYLTSVYCLGVLTDILDSV